MADRWYYARDENRLGPFSAKELRDLADAGRIVSTDTIWKDGVAAGVPAWRVKNLFAAKPVPVAPPPPARPAAPPQPTAGPSQPRKGRATAIRGAIIVTQDGTTVFFKKKCHRCGHEDNTRSRMPIATGTTRTRFFCPKCRKLGPVEIQGTL